MLAHGASAFFLLPLLGLAAWRGLPSWRWLGAAALVGVVLLAPWSAYQRFADPPGDRLLKWSAGRGELTIVEDGALETIADGYADAGVGGTLGNKWRNLRTIAAVDQTRQGVDAAIDHAEGGDLGEAVSALRLPRFFGSAAAARHLPAGAGGDGDCPGAGQPERSRLALWARRDRVLRPRHAGLGAAHVRQRRSERQRPPSAASPCRCSRSVAATVGLRGLHRLALALVAANVIAVLVLYVPSLTPPEGSSYSPFAALLAAAALAGFGCLCLRDGADADGDRPYTARPDLGPAARNAPYYLFAAALAVRRPW